MKRSISEKVQKIIEAAEKLPYYHDVSLHFDGFAEPGYSDPDSGVIALANWNPRSFDRPIPKTDNTMPRVAEALTRLGVLLDWEDEWAACDECGKLVRTSPDSYCWQRSFWLGPDALICHECLESDPTPYLEHLEGNSRECLTIDLDLGQYGYRCLEKGFEYGLHYGQDADPLKIGKALKKMGVKRFLFNLDSTGQFDSEFSVWVHEDDWDKITGWDKADKRCDVSPARMCEMALADASAKMSALEGEGVRVAKCKPDGTADVKLVSPEDFIAGRALD